VIPLTCISYSGQGLDPTTAGDAAGTTTDGAAAAAGNTSNSAAQHLDRNKLMSLLAQLRKATNHPFLFPGIEKVRATALSACCLVRVCPVDFVVGCKCCTVWVHHSWC
jgi:hypothetical protein